MLYVLVGIAIVALLTYWALVPTNVMLTRLQTILSQDTGSLAAATALKVHLAAAAFTPSNALTLAGLTEASFTGYAAINAVVGNAIVWNDPTTGLRQIELSPPAGGWHFAATGTTGLPTTIYGWYVTDNGVATLWGSALFTTPITLTNTGDGVDIASVRFALSPTSLS